VSVVCVDVDKALAAVRVKGAWFGSMGRAVLGIGPRGWSWGCSLSGGGGAEFALGYVVLFEVLRGGG
jgi:hypothetical protein